MKKSILLPAAVIVAGGVISGCVHTTDPRQGGLWNYDPDAYEARLQARQADLQNIEQNTQREQELATWLEQQKKSRLAELNALQSEASALTKELSALQSQVAAIEASTVESRSRKAKLEAKLQKAKFMSSNATSNADVDALRRQIAAVKAAKEQIYQELDILVDIE